MILLICWGGVARFLSGAEQQLYFQLFSENPDNICPPCKHKPIIWADKGKRKYLPTYFL